MMPMRWRSLSIRATVLVAIVGGIVLPALMVLALDARLSRETHQSFVERTRAGVMLLANATVIEPAWTLSEAGMAAALDRIAEEPSVCTIEVLDLMPALALAPRRERCGAQVPVQVLEAPVLHEGVRVARLRIAFNDAQRDEQLAGRRRITLWTVSAQVLVGVAVIAGLLSLRLLRPIDRLKRLAGRLSMREPMPSPALQPEDELGQLEHHLLEVHGQIRQLIGELEAKNQELHRMAMHDALTGLPNRVLLRELFAHEAALARRQGREMALLFIDLDRFKAVNDALGHAAGDELLIGVSQRLKGALRESDVVCRLSGDEFLVLLTHLESWEHAAASAERLLQALHEPVPLAAAQPAPSSACISASIGIALYPRDGTDFDVLVRAADEAMYRSKDLGRGRFSSTIADAPDAGARTDSPG